MPPKKKIYTPKYRPGNAGCVEEKPPLLIITLKNGDELRRAVARDLGDRWSGWWLDKPAMVSGVWPKFCWTLILQQSIEPENHPPESCSCNQFDMEMYGPREEGEHHRWCPFSPLRV